MISLRLQLKIDPDTRIGHGKIRLLEEIARTGSISDAARALGMTYRRAWDLLDHMNKAFGKPLFLGTTGSQGGAQLTDLGKILIHKYREMERDMLQIATPHLKSMSDLMEA